ncbi:site-2 protease family protein [Candidatus Saccharibacteria bacterium]|nr:site-2 protease family protein [Candidatus Saccharibacteria bacterium]
MDEIIQLVLVLVIVVGSVILHELMHGVMAYWLGDNTAKDAGRLTLNPLKHIDPYMSILVPVVLYLLKAPVFGGAKPVPVDYRHLKWKEWGMALVAVAGPATNFLLAFGAFLIGHFTGWIYGSGGKILEFVFLEMVLINIGFMIFNLIPIPPLDGSRVLYAIAPDGARTWLSSMEAYGFVVIYALILFFGQVFSGVMIGGMEGVLKFFYWIVGG